MANKIRKQRVPRTRNAGTFTESQYFSKIRAVLRNGFRYYKPMYVALELASRPSQSLNKRIKKEYKCSQCLKWYKRAAVEIHHTEECGSLNSYEDIVPFIKRLTKEDPSAYQIVCVPCHKKLTKKYLKSKK